MPSRAPSRDGSRCAGCSGALTERTFALSGLFDPFTVRGLTLRNRVVMAPMCQYSTTGDGIPTDWHLVHYGARATGGVGLVIVEATAVERRGRIDEGDLGLWTDDQVASYAPIVRACAAQGAAVGIQLAHAGRKAGSDAKGHWDDASVAPSTVPFDESWRTPHELSLAEIAGVVESFVAAARRAVSAGFQLIELHGAHGYLISSFLSPLANRRGDVYGGPIEARARFACEVAAAVRAVIPADMPLFMRVSGSDFDPAGNTVDDMVVAARLLKAAGVDLIHVSGGGNSSALPEVFPGYMVPQAEAIRREAGIPTVAVGMIWTAELADRIVRDGQADLVALGRELLRHPHWALDAACALGVDVAWPVQYERAKV